VKVPLKDANDKVIGSVELSEDAHGAIVGIVSPPSIVGRMILSPAFRHTANGWRLEYAALQWEAAQPKTK
jgi:hypothetical protein